MKDNKLHTPDGLRDILFEECQQKIEIETRMQTVFTRYGYKNIQSPTFEYFEVFADERGNIDPTQMYKFFDRDGHILVLRPDITPSIARIAATSLYDEVDPLRVSYIENTFRYNESYQGKTREVTQSGIELLGIDSAEADAEVIAIAVNCMIASGLERFQIDIGQVDFFKGIIEDAGLSEAVVEELRSLIDQKNFIAVEEVLEQFEMDLQLRDLILNLPKLFGSVEVIEQAKTMTNNRKARRALERLKEVYDILCDYGIEKYISFDLGMVNRLNYYTGIIFRGYTYGTGFSILDGGRYDSLVLQFGKHYPAVGFAVMIDELMIAVKRQGIDIPIFGIDTLLLYTPETRKIALEIADQYRTNNMIIETGLLDKTLDENIIYGKKRGIGGILSFIDKDNVELVNLETGKKVKTSLESLLKEGE